MALADGIIWAFVPKKQSTGYRVIDSAKTGTHLSWTSPAASNWSADAANIVVPRFTNSSDYASAERVIPQPVQRFSVVHWVKLTTTPSGFPNSLDGNFSLNVGPRVEYTTAVSWVYSAGVGLVGIDGGTLQSVGAWACYALTHDGNVTATTYNQGRPTGAAQSNLGGATGAFLGSFQNLQLGRGFSSARGCACVIGGTVIFNRQISASEVWQIYQAGPAAEWASGQTRRRVYGFVPATGARRRRILTGMV